MSERGNYLVAVALIFMGLPLLLWATGDAPTRTILKEVISVGSLLAFSLMLGLLFLTGRNTNAVEHLTLRSTVKIHKWIGYSGVAVLLLHPLLLVVPRYFESGVDPVEAFTTMITTFDCRGVVLGLVAWCLLLVLGITSLYRARLPMKHTTWRVFHGCLAVLFIVPAAWHAIDLGSHVGQATSIYVAILAGSGVVLLIQVYLLKPSIEKA